MSGWTGVDFSTYDLDQQVRHVTNDAGRSAMDNITRADPDRVWTVREVAQHVGIGGIGPVLVGTPAKVADEIEAWFDQTDVDGLNVPFAISPGDFEDIADLLVPELTRRGRYKDAYASGTLREKLFGAGRARLTAPHPAAQYRPHLRGEGCGVVLPVIASHRNDRLPLEFSNRVVDDHLDQLVPGRLKADDSADFNWPGSVIRIDSRPSDLATRRNRPRVDEFHADVVVVAVERQQPLLDDAVAAIVRDDERQRQLVVGGGPQRLDRLHRAAVAVVAHDRTVGIGEADADRVPAGPADAAGGQRC